MNFIYKQTSPCPSDRAKLVTTLTNRLRTLATDRFTGYNVHWFISADPMDKALGNGRNSDMKRILALLLIALTLAGSAAYGESASLLRGYDREEKWQYVTFGEYPYEEDGTVKEVLWRVLGIEDGGALLLSEYVLDLQQVIYCDNERDAVQTRNFRRLTDFIQSDLYTWMNSEMLNTMFSAGQQAALKETYYGLIYPLTTEQYTNTAYGFPAALFGVQKIRQAYATPYATTLELFPGSKKWSHPKKLYVDPGYGSSPHWVIAFKSATENGIMLQLCGYDGHLSYGVYTRRDVGVRPAVTVLLDRIGVTGGSGTKDDPFILAAQP